MTKIPDIEGIGIVSNGIIHVWGNEAIKLCNQGAILVDIREIFETAGCQFGIENIIFLPNSMFKENFEQLPKDRLLILADGVGIRSKDAVIFLKKNGFRHVLDLVGGIVDWERAGYKVIRNPSEMLHGQCTCMLKSDSGKKMNFK